MKACDCAAQWRKDLNYQVKLRQSCGDPALCDICTDEGKLPELSVIGSNTRRFTTVVACQKNLEGMHLREVFHCEACLDKIPRVGTVYEGDNRILRFERFISTVDMALCARGARVESIVAAINDTRVLPNSGVCSNPKCGAREIVGSRKFLACSGAGCKEASIITRYCCTMCQRDHWRAGHSVLCKSANKPNKTN
jgi:hypothetical protein